MARVVVAVAFLDLFMQFPVVGPYARSLGASPTLVGIIVAIYSFTNLGGNLLAGIILDRWGRIIPLKIGLLMTVLSLFGYVIVRSSAQLVVARALHGLSTSVLAPAAFAIIGDSSSPGNRVGVMGRSSAPIAAAAMLGPMIGAFVGRAAGYPSVFLLSAIIMLLVFAMVWASSHSGALASLSSHQDRREVRSNPHVNYRWLSVAYTTAFGMTVGLGALVTHLPSSLIAQGEASSASGPPFTVFALVATTIMASPLIPWSNHHGRLIPLIVGLLIVSLGLCSLGIFVGMSVAIVGMSIFGIGFGILFPSMTTVVVEGTYPQIRGRAFGIFYAVYSLGVVVGSTASGLLADIYGETSGVPFLMGMTVTLAVAAIIGLIGWLGLRDVTRREAAK